MSELTARERRVLEFVAQRIDETGCQPSYREICGRFHWTSTNSVSGVVEAARKKGVLLNRGAVRSRGLMFNWRKFL